MIAFWEEIKTTMEYMKQETQLGGSYRQKISSDRRYADGFDRYISGGGIQVGK